MDEQEDEIKDAAIVPATERPITNVVAPPDRHLARTTDEEFELEIAHLVPQAGTVVLTEEQKAILYAPVPADIVEIRPDGLIYLPWMEYVGRMTNAFGMSWSIVPKGQPKMNPARTGIFWGFYLIIGGKLAGFAIGEQAYYENNPTMTWGDAVEGAKSNALMRLCKGIGIGLELWKPSFVREWKDKFAEKYNDRGKERWRRKDREPEPEPEYNGGGGAAGKNVETAKAPQQSSSAPKTPPLNVTLKLSDGSTVTESLTKAYKRFEALKARLGETAYRAVLGEHGYEKKSDIKVCDIPKVFASLILLAAGPIPMKKAE